MPGRAALLPVLGVISGCLVVNPGFDVITGGAASSSETSATIATTSASAPGSSGSEGGTSSSDGSGTVGLTGTTGSTSTGESTAVTEPPASTGTSTDATTGEPPTAVVAHYDPAQCQEPLWCFANGNINDGINGEMRGAECFDAPLAPPYRVQRIDYTLVAIKGAPAIRFQVRDPTLAQVLYESKGMPAVVGTSSHAIPPEQQPIVATTRFCVGFVGGDGGSTLGMAADDEQPPPSGQTFYGSQACDKQGLLEVNDFVPEIIPHGPWCLGAEISGL